MAAGEFTAPTLRQSFWMIVNSTSGAEWQGLQGNGDVQANSGRRSFAAQPSTVCFISRSPLNVALDVALAESGNHSNGFTLFWLPPVLACAIHAE